MLVIKKDESFELGLTPIQGCLPFAPSVANMLYAVTNLRTLGCVTGPIFIEASAEYLSANDYFMSSVARKRSALLFDSHFAPQRCQTCLR
jgi:hypothetical protein